MASRKRVGDTDFVIGLWLSGEAPEGHTPNRHVYFRDKVIFSYGDHYPMARIDGKVVWLNEHRYSVTTNGHRSAVTRKATQAGYQVVEVRDVFATDHQADLDRAMEGIAQAIGKTLRRTRGLVYGPLSYLRNAVSVARTLCAACNVEFVYKFDPKVLHAIRHRVKRQRDLAQARKVAARLGA